MKKKILLACAVFTVSVQVFAQEQHIDTVFIFDQHLQEARGFTNATLLRKDDLLRNSTNLSDVLRFQSPVHVKETGRGLVSSPSFRGTTAQQTAVVWNGINVNSSFLGQASLNEFTILGYDQLQIKAGGGSVLYGSGAIGGTLHLTNELSFGRGAHGDVTAEYGSYKTLNTTLKAAYSDDRFSVKVSGSLAQSDNAYTVPQKNFTHLNGAYSNKSLGLGAGFRWNSRHQLLWQTEQSAGMMQNPIFSEYASRPEYYTSNFRSLLDYRYRNSKLKNSWKTAYLQENFKYFEDFNKPQSSGGTAETWLLKDDLSYFLTKDLTLNFIAEAQINTAHGYRSGIGDVRRWATSGALLLRGTPGNWFWQAGLKKDWVQSIFAPVLFSASVGRKFSPHYEVVLRGSKNFRYPSFNDLYWQPGGNMALKPEISWQTDMQNKLQYGDFTLTVTPFFISVQNMIRWLPGTGNIWVAANTDRVQSLGLESFAEYSKKFGRQYFSANIGYSFTKSTDAASRYRLSYVPLHKIFGSAAYRIGFAEILLQAAGNSEVYTDAAETATLQPYLVVNGGLILHFRKDAQLRFKVNNIFEQVYETTAFYPMPLRNYSTALTLHF